MVQFETGGDIEGGTRYVLETISEGTSRSANTGSQSDADRMYKEENLEVHEFEERAMGEMGDNAMVPMESQLIDRDV